MLKDVLLRCFVECFYNKDGKWYYAGTYTALRLADLTPKEFEQLSTEVCLSTCQLFLYQLLSTLDATRIHRHVTPTIDTP